MFPKPSIGRTRSIIATLIFAVCLLILRGVHGQDGPGIKYPTVTGRPDNLPPPLTLPTLGPSELVIREAIRNWSVTWREFSRANFVTLKRDFFPDSVLLLEEKSRWEAKFEKLEDWQAVSGNRLQLSSTVVKAGDIVLMRHGTDLLPMVYVGENYFSDREQSSALEEPRSFFLYPFSRLGGMELNTMPPRWNRTLVEGYKLLSEQPENELSGENTKGGMRDSGALFTLDNRNQGLSEAWVAAYEGASDSLSEFDARLKPGEWLQSPPIRGSLFVPTRWWKEGAEYCILRWKGDQRLLDASAIWLMAEEMKKVDPLFQIIRIDGIEGMRIAMYDARVEFATTQWIKESQYVDDLLAAYELLKPYKDSQSLKRRITEAEARVKKAEEVYATVLQLVRKEYVELGVSPPGPNDHGLEDDEITGLVLELGAGLPKGAYVLGKHLISYTTKAAANRAAFGLSREFGRDAVFHLADEGIEVITRSGARHLISSSDEIFSSLVREHLEAVLKRSGASLAGNSAWTRRARIVSSIDPKLVEETGLTAAELAAYKAAAKESGLIAGFRYSKSASLEYLEFGCTPKDIVLSEFAKVGKTSGIATAQTAEDAASILRLKEGYYVVPRSGGLPRNAAGETLDIPEDAGWFQVFKRRGMGFEPRQVFTPDGKPVVSDVDPFAFIDPSIPEKHFAVVAGDTRTTQWKRFMAVLDPLDPVKRILHGAQESYIAFAKGLFKNKGGGFLDEPTLWIIPGRFPGDEAIVFILPDRKALMEFYKDLRRRTLERLEK